MKRNIIIATLIIALITASYTFVFSWGAWGHQHINKAAVFALPEEMRVFFYNHIDFITEESVVPDLRKYVVGDKNEPPRHFIDIENFDKPIDSLPQKSKEAMATYDDKFLAKNGSLPWYIQDVMDKLTKAFKEKRKTEILMLAGDLGHYLGDAHMPLHTAANYDGQFTNQKGIHAFWESQLPELFGDSYNFNTGEAKYIDDVTKETWRIIKWTHALEDTLLATDRNLKATFPEDKIYAKDSTGAILRNKFNSPIHSLEYAKKYHEALHGMVENQMRLSIMATANFWYTAYVNAGKPDLSTLDDPALTKQNKSNYKKEVAQWKQGKLSNMKIDKEF